MATFFVRDLALAQVAKTCLHRPQALKKGQSWSGVSVEKHLFFKQAERADCMYPKARLQVSR